jgi:solute:Na+ symporter, SSS family
VAMASSFGVSIVLLVLKRQGQLELSTHHALLLTIAVTTVCWVVTAFLGPQTDRRTLAAFYRKVRPFGPGWRCIREEAGISESEAGATRENIPLALLGWSAGCAAIWASLFTVGNLLYGQLTRAGLLFAVFLASGLTLLAVIRRLWSGPSEAEVARVASDPEAS